MPNILTTDNFWNNGRNLRPDDDVLNQMQWQGVDNAFRNEDEPMIALVQERMGNSDFDDLKPIFLTTDRAAGRARQILKQLINREHFVAGSEHDADMKTGC